MLPLVLGGVALATIGYGVAKLFEDDCESSYRESRSKNENSPDEEIDDISPEAKEVITLFKKVKSELYRVSLSELHTALDEIQNLKSKFDIDSDVIVDGQYNFATISDDVKAEFVKYAEILTMTQKYIDTNLNKLDTIIISSNDFTAYGDDDKEFITNLENIRNLVVIATNSNMTVDGETISREVKRAFAKLQMIVE